MVYIVVNPGLDDDTIVVQQGTLISKQVLLANSSVLGTTTSGITALAPPVDSRIPVIPPSKSRVHTPAVGFTALPVPVIPTGAAQELPKKYVIGLFGKLYSAQSAVVSVA